MNTFKKIRRLFFRLLLIILISLILFIVTALIISSNYGGEIKEYTVNQINEQLEIKINVNEAEISVLEGFPYISVIFKDVVAWSNPDFNRFAFINIDTDTLFSAKRVYIQFSLIDLIRGQYRIKRIYASNGKLNLLSDAAGKTNFKLLKSRPQHEKKAFSLELQAVRISDFDVSFNNIAKKIQSSAYMKDVLFKGKFANKKYALATIASINLNSFQRDGINYADNFEISTKLILEINDSLASIKKGEVNLNNIPLEASGSFFLTGKSSLDIDIESRGFNLATIKSILGINISETDYLDVSGRGDLAIKIQGNLTRLEVPAINAVYLLQFDQIKYHDFDLRDLSLKGKFSNGKFRNPVSSYIAIEKFNINSHNSQASGTISLTNFKSPFIDLKLNGNINANNFNPLLSKAEIENLSGELLPDLSVRAQLLSLKNFGSNNIQSMGLSGKLGLANLRFTARGYLVSDLSGEIGFAGDSWYPEMIIKSDFGTIGCSMQADHVMKYLLGKNNGLWVNGKVEGKSINLSSLKGYKSESSQKQGFKFPEDIHFNLITSVDSFQYGKFNSGKAEVLLKYQPGLLKVQDMKINCMRGEISGNGAIIQNANLNMLLRTQNSLKNVDITQLFESFNNFNQDFIVADNLKGFITGNIDFATEMDSTFHIIASKTTAGSHLTISSGELNHFEPMKSLSKFIALEELENIRFSSIENNFSIKDEIISIPQMDIHSNAFNVTISGRHGFDNNFDYKMKVNLSEILAGKAKKAKRENEEFGIVEADNRRTSLYLSIIGNPDNYKIKYDKKEAVTQIKEDLNKEKQGLKQILNEEFGWFKKDSAANIQKTLQEKEKFIIVWDEEPEKKVQENSTKKKRKLWEKDEEDSLQFEWNEENK
jgi:AsmA-like C-terminal region